ncbi:hypothetical protein RJ640_008544 [Escallonia rubra]|uniref:Oxidative stress 3 n=1 Tax=Escallonia rubra TaxID=112253 RepID=A0AA88QXE8_9ASTE|nr:hypothetical protein RJ640_008544 [Escallonia rubra]
MLKMGEDRSQVFQAPCSLYQPSHVKEEEDQRGDDGCDTKASTTSSSSTTSFSSEDLSGGSSRSSSLDTTDDASSSACSSSDGSLYDLSQLMAQLPIKRGLSKYYQGKSESFTSLSSVRSLEDLAKKESRPYSKRMKACKSYGGGLDTYKSFTLPKPIISKRSSKGCLHSSSSFPRRRASFGSDCRPPLFPAQDYNLRC